VWLAGLVFVPMLMEARRSRRNEQQLRHQGAIEPEGDVYPLMQAAYPGLFLAILAESAGRLPQRGAVTAAGAAVFAAAKALKYWAIATLGHRWTFRVLVIPGLPPIATGPYRYLRHPNYAGVIGEYAGLALMANAPGTGALALALFGGLLRARIAIEERAMGGV
jgi:methyltransferase